MPSKRRRWASAIRARPAFVLGPGRQPTADCWMPLPLAPLPIGLPGPRRGRRNCGSGFGHHFLQSIKPTKDPFVHRGWFRLVRTSMRFSMSWGSMIRMERSTTEDKAVFQVVDEAATRYFSCRLPCPHTTVDLFAPRRAPRWSQRSRVVARHW